MTVVNWDLNLAFDTANVGGGAGGPGGAGGVAGGRQRPDAGAVPADAAAGQPGGIGGPGDQANVLVDRFLANDSFSQLYADQTAELTELLFTSGAADEALATWTDVLTSQASDLVDVATIESDAAAISAFVAASS